MRSEHEAEIKTDNESEIARVSNEGTAVGEAPKAVRRLRKKRKLRTPVVLDGLVTM